MLKKLRPGIKSILSLLNLKIFIVIFITILISSCGEKEEVKNVSLTQKNSTTSSQIMASDALKFGFDIRLEIREDVNIYAQFLNYLHKSTGFNFILNITEKYEDTAQNLGNGIIDFAAIGSVNYLLAKFKYNVNINCLAMGLNEEGKNEYRSIIFSRPNSNISNISDIKDKKFAFGDKLSTQGHIIPRKMLENAGISIKDLKSYVFTGSHANTVRAVINGKYDAGAIQDKLAYRLAKEGKIKIIAISKPYPSSIISYRNNLPNNTILKLKNALLDFDPKGKDKQLVPEWDKSEMPSGFTSCDEKKFDEIKDLMKKYGIL
jgi:phosphonate transport system substrate-binding protein